MGAVSIAFILLFLIGRLIIETEDFSWIVLLSVYGVDSVLTIIHRLMLHENIGLPHRKHLYQIMANELKIPHVIALCLYDNTDFYNSRIYLITNGMAISLDRVYLTVERNIRTLHEKVFFKTYLLNYCLPLYNFHGHLNTQALAIRSNITLLCFCIAAGHKKPSVA